MTAYLKNQIENLKSSAVNERNKINFQGNTNFVTHRPLTQQINELMLSLPDGIKNNPWSMKQMLLHLNGKFKERPHAQEVGEALLKLGWTPKRLWGKNFQGRRLWFPPK